MKDISKRPAQTNLDNHDRGYSKRQPRIILACGIAGIMLSACSSTGSVAKSHDVNLITGRNFVDRGTDLHYGTAYPEELLQSLLCAKKTSAKIVDIKPIESAGDQFKVEGWGYVPATGDANITAELANAPNRNPLTVESCANNYLSNIMLKVAVVKTADKGFASANGIEVDYVTGSGSQQASGVVTINQGLLYCVDAPICPESDLHAVVAPSH